MLDIRSGVKFKLAVVGNGKKQHAFFREARVWLW